MSDVASSDRFDVIVVGAGAAGCVLAADLAAADPSSRVLLLDAGPSDASPALRGANHFDAASAPGRTYADVRVRRVVGGEPTWYPLGRGIGGGTAINGMVCAVEPADFDRWGALPGCAAWSWSAVAPVARRLAARLRRAPADQLGAVDRALFQAAHDGSGGATLDPPVGVGVVTLAMSSGERRTALDVATGGAPPRNLVVRGDAEVRRVLLDGRRAVGIELADGAVVEGAEVVVAAGAVHTPVLLWRSGVEGDAIGAGLQDHPSASLTLRLREPADTTGNVSGVMARWHDGSLQALALNHVGVPEYGAIVVGLMRPRSAGRISWGDGTSDVAFDTFSDPADLHALRDGVRTMATMTASEPFAEIADAVFVDDRGTTVEALDDDAFVDRWLRETSGAHAHASSSCRMGEAVDARCRVDGYDALRICDASVFPDIPSTNPMLPAMILGARLAQLVLAER